MRADKTGLLGVASPGLEDGNILTKKRTLTRLVSEGTLPELTNGTKYVRGGEGVEGELQEGRSGSPMRCVSEFDEVIAVSQQRLRVSSDGSLFRANPLHDAGLRLSHIRALRLEADLQPMRMIVGRLMVHPTNKRGLFNAPVDALALGLLDYHLIVKKPMDLGTIKKKLYSISYQSRQEVADDIWLVFNNAMAYNPPRNLVHIAARSLRDFFDELYLAVGGEKMSAPDALAKQEPETPVCRRVSFTQDTPSCANPLGKSHKRISRTVSSHKDTTASDSSTVASILVSPNTHKEAAPMPSNSLGTPGSSEAEAFHNPSSPPKFTKRGRGTLVSLAATPVAIKHERKRRFSFAGHKRTEYHNCRSCLGRNCVLCEQGCLQLEPTLLVCNGGNCAGSRIRKGSIFYVASDGSRQYCQRCFASLPPVLSLTGEEDEAVRYKRDLLKRKYDEEIVESWLTCSKCNGGVHQMCALHHGSVSAAATENYLCPECAATPGGADCVSVPPTRCSDMYTFVTGASNPQRLSDISDLPGNLDHEAMSAEALPETGVSAFIESKVKESLKGAGVENAEKTITIRIISDCEKEFSVPEVVLKHFRMATKADELLPPPEKVCFNSKAIALFQRVDGLDVCIFIMYVQEYSGGQCTAIADPKKRVYIAYLDSVEHFRPRSARSSVYHELLVAYLASARLRGFETAHIWACPPSRGTSFAFWHHPESQRTPTKERLISWYHDVLSRAIQCGVVTDVKSLYESDFEHNLKEAGKDQDRSTPLHWSGKLVCPPLLDGDYWIEEAVRIHTESLARHRNPRFNDQKDAVGKQASPEACPARQIANLLMDRLMANPRAAPFRKPVNAAALKLTDYHQIITKPMDLGTVYSRCVHGEYGTLKDVVADVQLVFTNAKTFNPEGNYVHDMAVEMETLFFEELEQVTDGWHREGDKPVGWTAFAGMSMSLDMQLELAVVMSTVPNNADSSLEGSSTGICSDADSSTSESRSSSPVSGDVEMLERGDIKSPISVDDLLTGGADAVSLRMAGRDKWMVEKKPQGTPKRPSVAKKGGCKRRRSTTDIVASDQQDETSVKRRRQTWLGEEVSASVRSNRTSFFSCSLIPALSMSEKEKEKVMSFSDYTKEYNPLLESSAKAKTSRMADSRAALLEFSQRHNLEFNTLRHAKYSTAVLLSYLHNPDSPGLIPLCTSCNKEMKECRWHKTCKVEELGKRPSKRKSAKASGTMITQEKTKGPPEGKTKGQPEELCDECYQEHSCKDMFIPLPTCLSSS